MPTQFVAVALLGVCMILPAALGAFSDRDSTGQVIEYKFLEGQNVNPGSSAADSSTGIMGALNINLGYAAQWIGTRGGISVNGSASSSEFRARTASNGPISSTSSGWAMEVFATPAEASDSANPVVYAFTTAATGTDLSCSATTPFMLKQQGNQFVWHVYMSDGSCETETVAIDGTTQPTYYLGGCVPDGSGNVDIRFASGATSGSNPYFTKTCTSPNSWTTDLSARLVIAPRGSSGTGWSGKLYYLAFYTSGLLTTTRSPATVNQNRAAGLPNAKPVVTSFIATPSEDTPYNFTLSGSDAENDLVTLEITALELQGTLYYVTADDQLVNVATALAATNPLVLPSYNSQKMRYIPPDNQFGVMGNITYRGRNGSDISQAGVATVSVTAVNDPPVATPISTVGVAQTNVVLALSGTDIDSPTSTLTAKVTQLPAVGGSVYQYNSTTQSRGAILTAGATVTDSQRRVVYVSGPPGLAFSGQANVGADWFLFTVTDDDSTNPETSAVANVSVALTTNLQANPGNVTVNEDQNVTLTFTAVNNAGLSIGFTVSYPTSGKLYDITSGDLLPGTGAVQLAGNQVRYRGNLHSVANESLTVNARRSDGFLSLPATYTITTIAINDAPSLTPPSTVPTLSSVTAKDATPQASFTMTLSDVEQTTYTVTITAETGGQVDIVTETGITFSDQDGDASVAFSGAYTNVVNALTNMVYKSTRYGFRRWVMVQVQDGVHNFTAVAYFDVTCPTGYRGGASNLCEECPVGSYKDSVGNGTCTTCASQRPNSNTAGTGSISVDDCQCEGAFQLSGVTCVACPANTFKTGLGNTCSPCPSGENTDGQSGQSACVCGPGLYRVSTTCGACPVDTYKSHNSDAACSPCQSNTTTNGATQSISSAACVCSPGFGTPEGVTNSNGGQFCSICEYAQYKPAAGDTNCTHCPSQTNTTRRGATASSECVSTVTGGAGGDDDTLFGLGLQNEIVYGIGLVAVLLLVALAWCCKKRSAEKQLGQVSSKGQRLKSTDNLNSKEETPAVEFQEWMTEDVDGVLSNDRVQV